jgi:hypothetical protein
MRLREAFRRSWSWAVSTDAQIARIGQEYLLERVDQILMLISTTEAQDPTSPFGKLWRVRHGPHLGYPLGTRRLFASELDDGYWACFQALFVAVGLPRLNTFEGPYAHRTLPTKEKRAERDLRTRIDRGFPVPQAREIRSVDA